MNGKVSGAWMWWLRAIAAGALTLVASDIALSQERSSSSPSGEEPQKIQEVVITGSRIARPDLDRLEPTTVVGAQTFDQRGYTDVGQALSEVPSFGIQSSSAVGQQSNQFGIAQSFVDLFSLGSQRTLTLVNGHRFVSSNTAALGGTGVDTPAGQQVDLNLIPTKLIDRVETVSVGGAPIYGADAIAGTVNIIMKKNYEGFDVDAQAGVSNQKDAWNYRVRALGGANFFDDRGNITTVVELSKSDGLVGPDRKNFSANEGFLAPVNKGPFKNVLVPDNTVNQLSTGGVPYLDNFFYTTGFPNQFIGITTPNGTPLAFGQNGQLQPYSLGLPSGNPIFYQGGDGIRLSQFSNLLSPVERLNFDTIDNFKITDHINLTAETWFAEVHAQNLISQPAYNAAIFGAPGAFNGYFKINVNNPFLSPADSALIASELRAYQAQHFPAGAANTGCFNQPPDPHCAFAPLDPAWNPNVFYLARASTDLQSNGADGDELLGRGLVGLTGDFSVGERNYNWDATINYGYSRNTSTNPADVFQNIENALNATRNAQGQIICTPGYVNSPIKTGSSTCAPLDIFGRGNASPAALAYIIHDATAKSIDTQRDATANLTGDVFKLPAGEWKANIGFENRRESAKFSPDDYYTSGTEQLTAGPVNGSYITNEVYAETLLPIFEPNQAIPMLHQIELEGAIRRVDNSIAGNSNTWTAGARYAPVSDILFRGNRTVSIRAPAITELFLPPSTSNEFSNDPCDKNFVDQGLVPATRKKNCESQGINTATFTSNVVNATATGTTSGNTNLHSETADSYTYGVVLRPHWVPRLNIAVDYVDIKMTNAIQQLNLQDLMDECYDSTDFPNNPACSHFTRNALHQVTGYSDGFINAGLLHFQGITASGDYTVDLPWNAGSLETRAAYLDTRVLVLQVGSSAPLNEAGALNAAGFPTTPKGRGSLSLTWTKGPISWYWQALYDSGMNFDNQATPVTRNISRVNPWWLMNSTLTWNATSSFQMRLIVDNVFNKEPPFPALAAGTGGNFAGATSLYFPGIIGRTYLLAVDYHF